MVGARIQLASSSRVAVGLLSFAPVFIGSVWSHVIYDCYMVRSCCLGSLPIGIQFGAWFSLVWRIDVIPL